MLYTVHVNKSEVVAFLMLEAAVAPKPAGPFIVEMFPRGPAVDGQQECDGVILPYIVNTDPEHYGVMLLDPTHNDIHLGSLLRGIFWPAYKEYGYDPNDDAATDAARQKIVASLRDRVKINPDERYEIIYE